MAKVQRWKRRDPVGEEPLELPEEDSATLEPTPATVAPATAAREPGSAAEPDQEVDADAGAEQTVARTATSRLRLSILDSTPVVLFMAAHPRQAVLTAVGLGSAALVAGRPLREAAVVAATVLVGQTVLGWHNDIVDRERDARHGTARKPVAEGRIDVGSVWYAIVIAVLLVVPLSISTGVTAGTLYLGSLALGLLGNVALRQGRFSFLPWAASYALFPAYLSFGGWGGGAEGDPPQIAMTVLAALLGVGVHFLRSIWGLVADDADGWTYLPLQLGRRLGATRLLILSASYTAVVLAVMAILGGTIGLRQ